MAATEKPMGISVVVPFDIGESYLFKVDSPQCARCIWENIFSQSNSIDGWEWSTHRLGVSPTFYREPFGPVARLKRAQPISVDALDRLVQESVSCVKAFTSLEVIFFSRGIGVLVLRGAMKDNVASSKWRNLFYSIRGPLKDSLKGILVEAQSAYKAVMNERARDKRFAKERCVFPVKQIHGRRGVIDKARFPYAIGFFEGCHQPAQNGPTTLSKNELLKYRHPNPDCDAHPSVDVGWGETTVYCSADEPGRVQEEIENAFIAAMASWLSLIVMSSLVSEFMRDSFIDLSARRQMLNDERGQVIRLAFLDAANASRPVRWTWRERDILLLDRIHETWSSRRMWRSIEERTTLLAAHHNEAASELRRKSDKKLAVIGSILAATTVISAAKDFSDAQSGIKIGIAIAVVIFVLGYLIFWAFLPSADEDRSTIGR